MLPIVEEALDLTTKTDAIPVVVFDIDGTLANVAHRQHHLLKEPKDWDAFFADMHLDPVHDHIAELAYLIASKHPFWRVVCATGRDERHRESTTEWLDKESILYEALYMRREGDRRDDAVVKIEMIEQMKADGFLPIMVFEDRDRVVKAWRAAGIPCLQTAEGGF